MRPDESYFFEVDLPVDFICDYFVPVSEIEMLEIHKTALDEAKVWIEQNYKPIGIIASGSIIRGNPNAKSDFDIYVIHDEEFRQRIQKYFNKVPCEIFINSIEQTRASFIKEQMENRPVTAHMLATGLVIKGEENNNVKSVLDEAKAYQNKPKDFNEHDLTLFKYGISIWLEDANDIAADDEVTCHYILGKVTDKIIEYWFFKNQRPLPRIKERFNIIKTADGEFYGSICSLFNERNVKEKLKSLNVLVEKELGVKGFFEWQTEKQ
ncbi:MAG: nucleotidyltransferase domain-containing protein [Chitinophagales bacterium]